MRLKSLKLAGFKSFANPTTFSFKHDITAIVGPNGCGKSNVIDAIRWVLGESSAKQIRGSAMSDVIFAGTDGKTARSMASVELHFEHTQEGATGIRHALNLYHELTLRRQITSDGKSDYFINNQKVRRRDVVDVFLGTGLSSRSYAVIEQGMIGRIIDADGQKLREFIEEAAGVSRYEVRRSETQKQLEIARTNLERLDDLQGELTSQYKILTKQAKSALTYRTLNDELGVVHTQILTHRLYQAYQAHQSATHDLQTAHQTLKTHNEQMTQLRSRLQSLAQEHSTQTALQATATHAHHKAQLELSHATNELTNAQTAQATLVGELDKITLALNDANERQAHHAQELDLHTQNLQTLEPSLLELQSNIAHAQNTHQTVSAKLINIGQSLSGAYQERQSLQNAMAVNDNAQNRHRQARQKWQQKSKQWHTQKSELNQNDTDELSTLSEQITQLSAQLEMLEESIDGSRATSDGLGGQIGELERTLHRQQHQHATLTGEQSTLYRLIDAPKTTTDGDCGLPSVKDTLALSQTGERYVQVLDKWLGLLLSDKVGNASDSGVSDAVASKTDTPNMPALTLWHKQMAHQTAKDGVSALPDGLIRLSKLIESPKLALFERVAIATCPPTTVSDGVCVLFGEQMLTSVGVIHKDKFGKADETFLATQKAHETRLAELDGLIDALEREIDTTQADLRAKKSEHARTLVALDEYTEQAKRIRHAHHTAQNTHTRLSTQALSYAKDQERLAKERVLLDEEEQELTSEESTLSEQSATLTAKLDALSPVIADKKSEQERLRQEQSTLASELKAWQRQEQQALLSIQKHKQAIEFIQKTQKNDQSELARLSEQKTALQANLATLQATLPTLQKTHAQAQQAYDDAYAQTQGFDDTLSVLRDEQQTLEHTQQALQQTLDQTHASLGNLSATVAMGVAKMGEIGTQLGERCPDFELDAQLQAFADGDVPQGKFDEWLGKQKTLTQQISGLGAVNLAAADELAQLEARLSPLQKERQDIEDSIKALNTAMGQINQQTKKLFLDTLKAVNEQMNALFVKVFGGGQASLTLMDDNALPKADQWQAPLVLMAQPKGKKNSRLAVLSGGEKTLTALSLVFAIFKQHPAPFCVLDEVDAPLDDANVQRFTNLIEELAREVQFIFISHNKLAMQKAHELKGVTMPTAGVSALVSVDLGEAMAMVE